VSLFSHSLIPLTNLQSLGLSANRLTSESLPTIIGNLCAGALLHLDLSFNALHDFGAKALETFFRSKTVLKFLDISSCNLHCSDMKAICAGLQMCQHELQDLNLSSNKILHDGAEFLCQYLSCRFATVTHLNLSWNTIGEQGTVAFANIMCYARSIQKLSLVSNNLGDVGTQNLIASIDPNTSNMTELDLTQNSIGSCACFVIAWVSNAFMNSLSAMLLDRYDHRVGCIASVLCQLYFIVELIRICLCMSLLLLLETKIIAQTEKTRFEFKSSWRSWCSSYFPRDSSRLVLFYHYEGLLLSSQ
jgi:hypothetical protein